MAKNANLHKAKKEKNDEFYTRREDIENELCHYAEHFRDKVVYCNCDDPETSEFWQFFKRNFKPWGLKRLIATHYEPDEKNYAYSLEISQDTNGDGVVDYRDEPTVTPLPCNGDFRSAACIELLKQADIVVTNPPFSLFREYVAQLIEYGKKFIIIGNVNAITCKEIFPLIKSNKMWIGISIHSGDRKFNVPDNYPLMAANCGIDEDGKKYIRVKGVRWFTNLDIPQRHVPLDLRGNYYYGNEDKYPKYDNYDAIECSKTADIPCDYKPCWYDCPQAAECQYAQMEGAKDAIALCEQKCNGEIGVPITYLDKHNPEQMEIVGADYQKAEPEPLENGKIGTGRFYIKGIDNNKEYDDNPLTDGRTDGRTDESSSAFTVESSSVSRRKCNGVIGVPITFLDKYCPEQFRIIWQASGNTRASSPASVLEYLKYEKHNADRGGCPVIKGQRAYSRILIQKV